MSTITDEQLVRQYLKNKDEKALEDLIRRYLPLIYGFVKRYTGNEDNASDITQETFVKVWQNMDRFNQTKNFRTWIFTIAKRTAIDWLRRKNALPFSMLSEEKDKSFIESIADESISIIEQFSFQETSKKLALAFVKMPDRYSSIIKLRINDDLTFDKISKLTNRPLNTVKSQYRRGLILLRRILLEK